LPAVAVVVDKLKEEGEEKMKTIREQLLSLDFKESFIGKLLKDYPAEKIEEKLELLLEKKNINRPAGWFLAALKYDYKSPEPQSHGEDVRESNKPTENLHNNVIASPDLSGRGNLIDEDLIHRTREDSKCHCQPGLPYCPVDTLNLSYR